MIKLIVKIFLKSSIGEIVIKLSSDFVTVFRKINTFETAISH